MVQSAAKTKFFTHDRSFYKQFFGMVVVLALQNIIAYSVNMMDNIMLGSYSQVALSAVTIVNQIFYVIQQTSNALGDSLVIPASQYWGQNRVRPIQRLTLIAMRWALVFVAVICAACLLFPHFVLSLFTSDAAILEEAVGYLYIVAWSFVLFVISNTLMAVLRSVGTVRISFIISIISLVINVAGNAVFIYGLFGFPEMGARGAALSTLISRVIELAVLLVYLARFDRKLHLFSEHPDQSGEDDEAERRQSDRILQRDFTKVAVPVVLTRVLWSVSVPIQTAILGHLSSDAIAANSVSATFYQYLKMILVGLASAENVIIGNDIGRGDMERVKSDARSLTFIAVVLGIVLGCILFAMRVPLLSFYNLSDTAVSMAMNIMAVMSVVMVGMSFEMPVTDGIICGGGNPEFALKVSLISFWCISLPLSLCAAFWWKLPAALVVLCLQSDQIFKCVPNFLHLRSYQWIRILTNEKC